MAPAEILLYIMTVFMCWFCFSFFYMVNFLRRSGETRLDFIPAIVSIATGKIMELYDFFITVHSRTHNRRISKLVAYSNMASFIGLVLLPFIYVFAEAAMV